MNNGILNEISTFYALNVSRIEAGMRCANLFLSLCICVNRKRICEWVEASEKSEMKNKESNKKRKDK